MPASLGEAESSVATEAAAMMIVILDTGCALPEGGLCPDVAPIWIGARSAAPAVGRHRRFGATDRIHASPRAQSEVTDL